MSHVIVAVSTGNQISAIGIIRLSGEGCAEVAGQVFTLASGLPLNQAPNRKLWFREGIQVNENLGERSDGDRYDHIGIQVDNWELLRRRAEEMGCTPVPGKPHWFVTPDKIVIELMR